MIARANETSVAARWKIDRLPTLALLAGWIGAVVATLLVDAALGPRFLDLPLSALVASQGAMVALVVVGVRTAALDRIVDDH
jgi:uncharacterized membrane protein